MLELDFFVSSLLCGLLLPLATLQRLPVAWTYAEAILNAYERERLPITEQVSRFPMNAVGQPIPLF